jgi:hypothetical protein
VFQSILLPALLGAGPPSSALQAASSISRSPAGLGCRGYHDAPPERGRKELEHPSSVPLRPSLGSSLWPRSHASSIGASAVADSPTTEGVLIGDVFIALPLSLPSLVVGTSVPTVISCSPPQPATQSTGVPPTPPSGVVCDLATVCFGSQEQLTPMVSAPTTSPLDVECMGICSCMRD